MPRARLRERNLCHYCHTRPGTTTDHIVPRAFSGPDAMWNYVSSCEVCNLEKAANWPTCSCSRCVAAVERFLSDENRRERALARLAAQMAEMNNGISALIERHDRLLGHRDRLSGLYIGIMNYRIETTEDAAE